MAGAGRARRRIRPRPQPGALRDRPRRRAHGRPAAGGASGVAARVFPRDGRRLAAFRVVDEEDVVEGFGFGFGWLGSFGRGVPRLSPQARRTGPSPPRVDGAGLRRRADRARQRAGALDRWRGTVKPGRARPVPDPLGLRRRGAIARGAGRTRGGRDPPFHGRAGNPMASETGRRAHRLRRNLSRPGGGSHASGRRSESGAELPRRGRVRSRAGRDPTHARGRRHGRRRAARPALPRIFLERRPGGSRVRARGRGLPDALDGLRQWTFRW